MLLARQLKLMVRRRMRLMLTVIVLVIFAVLVIIVVVCHMCAGHGTAAVMHLRQEMNSHVIDMEREQSRRQQANPPPTRSRAGWQNALLT